MADTATRLRALRTGPRAWSRWTSLTTRFLLVNLVAVAILAGSILYLDFYRNQQTEGRYDLALSEAQITAEALAGAKQERIRALLVQIGKEQRLRLRLYNPGGGLAYDSFTLDDPSFAFRDPKTESWTEDLGQRIDLAIDTLLRRKAISPYEEPATDEQDSWPEIIAAREQARSQVFLRTAPDGSPVITTAAPVGTDGAMLLTMRNDLELADDVREGRSAILLAVLGAFTVSVLLSLFLARTIVQPMRDLVQAAVRVRLGRDREVEVPRLPQRRDEIGLLARAISDMTTALRQRIDSTESFAADVAHEIKNPLASLRSALESLGKVEAPELRTQLMDIATHDVRRIDRLVTEISDASRVDAEISRAVFEPIDLDKLVGAILEARRERHENADITVETRRVGVPPATVMGVPVRLEMIIDNLLDNAVSFSPPDGVLQVKVFTSDEIVQLSVCDDGPGVSEDQREKIFARFHSERPDTEDFGSHSGLGLAIARGIAEAHDGSLRVEDRHDGKPGACFILELPAAAER
ncbi:sensor histidine kinase [Altererythrobacter sp. CAU 1778]